MATELKYLLEVYPNASFSYAPPPVVQTSWGPIYPGQSYPGGYGSKISTDYKVSIGDGRSRRVYCCVYSNVGSLYVLIEGDRYYVRDQDLDSVRNR